MIHKIHLSSSILASFNYANVTIISGYLKTPYELNYTQKVVFYFAIGELLKRRESKWRGFCGKDLDGFNLIITKLIGEMGIKHGICEYSDHIIIGCQIIDYKTLRKFHDALGRTI